MRHGINELISKGINEDIIQKYVHTGLAVRNIKEYFANELDYSLNQARNEILAYFKGGKDSDEILSNMIELEAYDYLSDSKFERQKTKNGEDGKCGDKILERYKPKIIKKERVKCQEKHKKIISESLSVIDDLDRWGFPRGEIIGMFQTQELKYWKKLFERLKKNPQFIEERNRHSDEKAAQLDENLRQYRKNNSWLKRKIDKLKIRLPFGLSDRIAPESYAELLLEKELKLLNKERLGWK